MLTWSYLLLRVKAGKTYVGMHPVMSYKKLIKREYFHLHLTLTLNSFRFGGACQYARAIEFISYSCSYNFYLCFLFIKEINCAFYQKLEFEVFEKHTCFSEAHVFFIPEEFIAFFLPFMYFLFKFSFKNFN